LDGKINSQPIASVGRNDYYENSESLKAVNCDLYTYNQDELSSEISNTSIIGQPKKIRFFHPMKDIVYADLAGAAVGVVRGALIGLVGGTVTIPVVGTAVGGACGALVGLVGGAIVSSAVAAGHGVIRWLIGW
jgi:uncharacterized membrane protein